MKPLRVLSLFDGISCGQVALERAGIPVEVYYASEIDKYAIQITQKNYPKTIQLGDVREIDFTQFIGKIDLLIGGSPCQDLSIAGKRKGLEGARSGLFYKYVEALEIIKPKYFLLENNYGMPQEAYEEISRCVGCYPILINSALVSAQNRRRYYWTNIGDKQFNLFGFPTCDIPQPKDKGIILDDVLLKAGDDYYLTNKMIHYILNSDTKNYNPSLTLNPKKANALLCRYVYRAGVSNYIAEPLKIPENTKKGYIEIKQGQCFNLTQPNSKTRRGRGMFEKCNCLTCQNEFYQYMGVNLDLPDGKYVIRKLTPIECERLQTLPDNYTEGVSTTQRYKCIGNGWTVDVIAHIFSFIKEGENDETII